MAGAPKKYTQEIFDDLKGKEDPGPYGYLGLMFEVIAKLTDIRNFKKRITQHELAKKSEIPQSAIARFEAGRGNPTLMQLVKIAKALDQKITFTPAKFSDGDYEGYKD